MRMPKWPVRALLVDSGLAIDRSEVRENQTPEIKGAQRRSPVLKGNNSRYLVVSLGNMFTF